MFSVHGSGCCMAQNLGDCYVEKRGKTTRIFWWQDDFFILFDALFMCFLTLPKWLIFYDFDVSKKTAYVRCFLTFEIGEKNDFFIAEAEAKKRFFTVEKSLFFLSIFSLFGVVEEPPCCFFWGWGSASLLLFLSLVNFLHIAIELS